MKYQRRTFHGMNLHDRFDMMASFGEVIQALVGHLGGTHYLHLGLKFGEISHSSWGWQWSRYWFQLSGFAEKAGVIFNCCKSFLFRELENFWVLDFDIRAANEMHQAVSWSNIVLDAGKAMLIEIWMVDYSGSCFDFLFKVGEMGGKGGWECEGKVLNYYDRFFVLKSWSQLYIRRRRSRSRSRRRRGEKGISFIFMLGTSLQSLSLLTLDTPLALQNTFS